MILEKLASYAKAVLAICALIGGGWWLADEFGVRPVFSRDLESLSVQVATNTKEVLWLRYQQIERAKGYRPLTPRECAEYRALAAQLNLPVPSC